MKERIEQVLHILSLAGLRVKFVNDQKKGVVARAQTVSTEREALTHDDDVAVIYTSGSVREWNRGMVLPLSAWIEELKPYLKLTPEQEEELRSLISGWYRSAKRLRESQKDEVIDELREVWKREKGYELPKWFERNATYVVDVDAFLLKLDELAWEYDESHIHIHVVKEGIELYIPSEKGGEEVVEKIEDLVRFAPKGGVLYAENPYRYMREKIENVGKPPGIYYPLVDFRTGLLFGYGVRKVAYSEDEPKHMTFKTPMIQVQVIERAGTVLVRHEVYRPCMKLRGKKEGIVHITESVADAVVVNEKLDVDAIPLLGASASQIPREVFQYQKVVFATDPDETGKTTVKQFIEEKHETIFRQNTHVAYQYDPEGEDIDVALAHGKKTKIEDLKELLMEILAEKLRKKVEVDELVCTIPPCWKKTIEHFSEAIEMGKEHALSMFGLLLRSDVGFMRGSPEYTLLLLLFQRLGYVDVKQSFEKDRVVFKPKGSDIESTTFCSSVCSFYVDRSECKTCPMKAPGSVLPGHAKVSTYSYTQKVYTVVIPYIDDFHEIREEEIEVKNTSGDPLKYVRFPVRMSQNVKALTAYAVKRTIRDAQIDEVDEEDLMSLLRAVIVDIAGSTKIGSYGGEKEEFRGTVLIPRSAFFGRIRVHVEHMKLRVSEREATKLMEEYGWIVRGKAQLRVNGERVSAIGVKEELIREILPLDMSVPEENEETEEEIDLEVPAPGGTETNGKGDTESVIEEIRKKLNDYYHREAELEVRKEGDEIVFVVEGEERRWSKEKVIPEKVEIILSDLIGAVEGEPPL